jgi:hypothetical protein
MTVQRAAARQSKRGKPPPRRYAVACVNCYRQQMTKPLGTDFYNTGRCGPRPDEPACTTCGQPYQPVLVERVPPNAPLFVQQPGAGAPQSVRRLADKPYTLWRQATPNGAQPGWRTHLCNHATTAMTCPNGGPLACPFYHYPWEQRQRRRVREAFSEGGADGKDEAEPAERPAVQEGGGSNSKEPGECSFWVRSGRTFCLRGRRCPLPHRLSPDLRSEPGAGQ